MHAISFALVLLFTSTALADQVTQSEIDVIDGSTVRVHGQVIHIVGIDTPKLGEKSALRARTDGRCASDISASPNRPERSADRGRQGGLFMSTGSAWLDGL
jgi:hypothetical protein